DNSDRYFEGFINGKINAEGSFGEALDYFVTADLDSVVFSADKRKIVHGSKFQAELRSDIIELKNIDLILLDDGFFRVGGTIEQSKDLDLFTDMSLPLKSLSFIVPELSETEGYLRGILKAGGDVSDPVLTGKLTLDKLGMILPVTDQKLYDVNGEISFAKERISINEISGRIDNGTLGIGGIISLDGTEITYIDMSVKTTALPFEYPEHLEGLVNTDLKFSGTPAKGALKGSILIVDALYYKDVDLFGGVFKGSGAKTVKTTSENDSLPEISLDLTLKSRRTLVMDNNLGFLELNPDLQIKGDISNPLISGRAVIQKDGFIVFQKKTFTVNKGVLDFEPVYGMLPIADIQSQTEVNTHKIFLSISENLSNPKFTLSSVPPESDADILSLLLFGRKTSQFSSGGEGVSKEKLIADWLTSAYSEDIAKKTGLDYIEVGVSDDFSAKEPAGYGITVGKKISDRLILKYSVANNGSEMIQKGIADYQLLENVIFSGFQSTDGTFGAETQFRKEFR
ncbi:MAG: translocation/assembly module TamB domain-containing protein, partial [Candidatus Delongbacteria bacterium]|nr:translocation/assembly module TamB domain-containing protein [Candidatus Delongbacteria bacterium]